MLVQTDRISIRLLESHEYIQHLNFPVLVTALRTIKFTSADVTCLVTTSVSWWRSSISSRSTGLIDGGR